MSCSFILCYLRVVFIYYFVNLIVRLGLLFKFDMSVFCCLFYVVCYGLGFGKKWVFEGGV